MRSNHFVAPSKSRISVVAGVLLSILMCHNTWLRADDGAVNALMAGYLLAPNEKVPADYDAGFSMYVSAWPLLDQYPGRKFQTGLFGTWMFPVYDPPVARPLKEGVYTDIEGGLGWWRDTRFATETPKFIMGGVDLNFRRWANGPGAGKGRDWDQPKGKYGVAQLSPWVLWPPDGLNIERGTEGELFGYGYLPLPLTEPKTTTSGVTVPTGNQSWTLFLNTQNFKGPVAFFTPHFWSQILTEKPDLAGKLLDTSGVNPNRSLQMETQYVPARIATTNDGNRFASVASVRYPRSVDGKTSVVHRVMSFKRSALWDSVEAWFAGGEIATGKVDSASGVVHAFTGGGAATWKIYDAQTPKDDRSAVDWGAIAKPMATDDGTFGYQWSDGVTAADKLVELPRFFKLNEARNGKSVWQAISETELPAELADLRTPFPGYERTDTEPYETPDESDSCWKTPGPVAGPFQAMPGDGSVVTYYWYRFADQPAILNADLTDQERELLQTRVEKLHRNWTHDLNYLPAPRTGTLANVDDALIVSPPKGLEIGYVPVVTRQSAR